jgi:outer membrane lipopolysaccharide assembly protein LptE/RlpB
MRLLALMTATLLAGCGYHVSGTSNLLPKEIKTIAVPAWKNASTQYRFSDYIAEAVTREFIARTRYTIVADPAAADAVLTGAVARLLSSATVLDPVTNRATGAQIIVQVQVRLTGKDGKVLFDQPALEFRDRYEISVDAKQYFDESQVASERIAQDIARTVVSAVLESF